MQSLPFRACSFLVVIALVLSSCNIAPTIEKDEDVDTLSISAATKDSLESNTEFQKVIKKLRAAGKKVNIADARESVNKNGDTEVFLPYQSDGNQRQYLAVSTKAKSIKRLVLGQLTRIGNEMTSITSDAITGNIIKTVATQDSQGKVALTSWEVGKQESNLSLAAMLTPISTSSSKTSQATLTIQGSACLNAQQNFIAAASAQAAAGYATWVVCGGGWLWFTPPCWAAAAVFAAAALYTSFMLDQMQRCNG